MASDGRDGCLQRQSLKGRRPSNRNLCASRGLIKACNRIPGSPLAAPPPPLYERSASWLLQIPRQIHACKAQVQVFKTFYCLHLLPAGRHCRD